MEAIYFICHQSETLVDLDKADTLFVNVCKDFQSLRSQECITNRYLKECILDYGLSYVYWEYAFELCNDYSGQCYKQQKEKAPSTDGSFSERTTAVHQNFQICAKLAQCLQMTRCSKIGVHYLH